MPPRKKSVRRKKVAPGSVGLIATEAVNVESRELDTLAAHVEKDGGAIVGRYKDPFGGQPLLVAALPIDKVEPTPYQRDPSDAHVKRLMGVIEKIGRFLDPIVAVREDSGYWTPNGNHRLQALKKLGEKSLETIRMARALAKSSDQKESAYAFEFELPSFLTLGVAYEERPRLSGGAYSSILRRVDEFLDDALSKALKERDRRGKKILKLDDIVTAAVDKLKAKGLTSPYLRSFVVSRVNYTRFSKATSFDFDEALDKIIASAQKFNADRVKQEDVAKAGGGPPEEE